MIKPYIYTYHNWSMLLYLFPNGTFNRDSYTVWIDASSSSYRTKLARLSKRSEYLAQLMSVYSDYECVTFIKRF